MTAEPKDRRGPVEPVRNTTKVRATYLLRPEQELVSGWLAQVETMFDGVVPYLVGSVLQRPNYRDVDVRVMLPCERLVLIPIDFRWLNLCVSLWGQRVTGLPIDFQVQSLEEGNTFDGPRNPLGLRHRSPTARSTNRD